MKNIGKFLYGGRIESGISVKELSKTTRIKIEFIESIENERWEKLPELPVLAGFVKSICDALNLSRDQGVALLRRDYPPKKLLVNPTPEIKKEFRFGPRTAFFLLGLVAILIMGGYLFYQYRAFVSPPTLSVLSPAQNELVSSSKITVRGTTDPSATVVINGQSVLPDEEGNFVASIDVVSETKQIEVKATSRSGRLTVVSRIIQVSLAKP